MGSYELALSSLPFTCGVCAIGSALGMKVCYVVPTVHILYTTYVRGFVAMYEMSGLQLLWGSLGEESQGDSDSTEASEMEAYRLHVERKSFMNSEERKMRQSREDLWMKILDTRQKTTKSE